MDETKKVTNDSDGEDAKGAVEEDVQRIREIKGTDVLGYTGSAKEEHSGQETEGTPSKSLTNDFADNAPDELSPAAREGIKKQ